MGLIFVALGSGAFVLWYFLRKKAQATMTWPAAPGMINDSRLEVREDSDGSVSTSASITYAYSIGPASYYGNRVCIGGARNPNNLVNRYQPGIQVQVFYDPQNPTSCVLERGTSGLWIWPTLGGVFLVVGLLIVAR
jgi:hypothetical protein